jgi:hypothetical protein
MLVLHERLVVLSSKRLALYRSVTLLSTVIRECGNVLGRQCSTDINHGEVELQNQRETICACMMSCTNPIAHRLPASMPPGHDVLKYVVGISN